MTGNWESAGKLIVRASENAAGGESVSANLLDTVSGNLAAPAGAILEAAGTSVEEVTENLNAVQQFLKDLPTKLFQFGVKAVFALILFWIGSKLINLVRKFVKKSMDRANADLGLRQFTDSLIKVALYALLIVWIAGTFGIETTSLIAVLGSAGVAVALALQGSLSNITGGVLLLILKPFKIGDYIKEDSKGNEGTVTEIGLFYTKLRTVDDKVVILPNGTLANTSLTNVNLSPNRRIILLLGISYDADVAKAKKIVADLLEEEPKVLKEPGIQVYVDALDASQVTIGVRAYVKNEDFFEVKWRITEKVKLAFDANGVEIPYNKLDVMVKEWPEQKTGA
ncbi:MAG: mechanosensitive ion channel [Lachnospiraceae bacterium]|nr:mechanosensitive ion channel [Lachnospiraceae bacterium]